MYIQVHTHIHIIYIIIHIIYIYAHICINQISFKKITEN